jgi:AraC family transcriptional regulator
MAEDNFCGEWEGDWGGRILYVSKGFIENFACNLAERLKPEICTVGLDGVKYTESPRITHLISLLHADVLAGCLDGPSLGEQLIIRILNHFFPEKDDRVIGRRRGSALREINSLRDMIHAQIGCHLSLQDLASASGLSSRQLCRIFRTETGASPHAYIMRCRVERACALIAESKLGLAEIASICGFSDQAHMTVTFRKLLKSSPSEFRSKSHSRACHSALPDVSRGVV